MLNYVVTFFILAILAAFLGFGGLASDFADIARFLALLFVVLLVASVVFGAISGRRANTPL